MKISFAQLLGRQLLSGRLPALQKRFDALPEGHEFSGIVVSEVSDGYRIKIPKPLGVDALEGLPRRLAREIEYVNGDPAPGGFQTSVPSAPRRPPPR